MLSIDCALTCSFYYNQEQEWAGGLTLAKIPFITIHKESSELDHYHLNGFLDNLEEINYKYQGDSIIVSNKRMEELFKKRNMFKNNKIIASGIMKYDDLFKKIKKKIKKQNKKIITLFSFFHYLSNIKQSDTGFDRYVEKNLNVFRSSLQLFQDAEKIFPAQDLAQANSGIPGGCGANVVCLHAFLLCSATGFGTLRNSRYAAEFYFERTSRQKKNLEEGHNNVCNFQSVKFFRMHRQSFFPDQTELFFHGEEVVSSQIRILRSNQPLIPDIFQEQP